MPLIGIICLLLCFAGCGGGGGGTSTTQPPNLPGILRLAWDPNTEPDLDHYLVYYDTTSRSGKPYPNQAISIPIQAGTPIIYDLQGLIKGQTYFIRVSAVDYVGLESPLSNEATGVAK